LQHSRQRLSRCAETTVAHEYDLVAGFQSRGHICYELIVIGKLPQFASERQQRLVETLVHIGWTKHPDKIRSIERRTELIVVYTQFHRIRTRFDRDDNIKPAEKDRCVPDDFYSTTNHRTHVRLGGRWVEVEQQRMDAVIVASAGRAACRKLRDVRAGEPVVCGNEGIRVTPEFRERDRLGFAFMSNDVSSERRVEGAVGRIADMIRQVKQGGGRVAVVAGPVVVHTGGVEHFCELIRLGYVNTVLAGNALAVHDIEFALSGTSLGIDLIAGAAVEQGHRNHMAAINTINRAGGIRQAVESGVLKSGVMYECIKHGVEFVLAGSIRDDGPLPETVMDLVEAQERYAAALSKDVQLVLMLSTMLHSIGVGNMLPSWVRVVCVDINPAVVTKLSDRGSAQTVGVVTDVGLFLHRLAESLRS
jgi:lysine-ketoglutarate reductase/saccharopine dehydrogenase-like protein (TIGR00300 family)